MKLTVNKVWGNNSQDFNKKPYISKYGKPYKVAKVGFAETGDKKVKMTRWENDDVTEGMVFDGEVVEKEFKGVKYFEFEAIKKEQALANENASLKGTLHELEKRLKVVEDYCKAHSEGKINSDFSAERVNARVSDLKKKDFRDVRDSFTSKEDEAITPDDIPF